MPFPTWQALPALLTLGLAACASDRTGSYYLHPNADLSTYQRVAVLPLGNMTSDRFAHERVREVISVELAALGAFEVAETGEVNRTLRELGLSDLSEMDATQVASLGDALRVQALLEGSVMEFRERRTGSFTAPEIALSLRLVDVESGVVLWSVTDSETGIGLRTRLFGVGEKTQSDVARDLVRKLVLDLFEMGAT